MSETKNYHLILTDDNKTKFKDWRESINGDTNSNMIKIDTALGEKANLSIMIDAVLFASAWSENAPYTQTILIDSLTASQNGVISVAQNLTSEQLEVVSAAEMIVSIQEDGSLTIKANGDKPTCDIPVMIILLG